MSMEGLQENLEAPPVTATALADAAIEAMPTNSASAQPAGEPDFVVFENIFREPGVAPETVDTPQKKATRELWGEKDPLSVISINGVKQSIYPDCLFMSTLASQANTEEGKKQISQMIKVDADGSYIVTFPGDKNNPITISHDELVNSGSSSSQATWARVIETAYLKYLNETPGVGLFRADDMPRLGRGLSAPGVMKLLTGAETASDQLTGVSLGQKSGLGATSIENVGRDLEEAMKNGLVVTAGIDPDFLAKIQGLDPSRSADPLIDQHQYSVVGYDPQTKTVTVRNPWGHMQGDLAATGATVDGITHVGDGKMTMSLDTFYKNFSSVQFSNTNPDVHAAQNVLDTIADRNDNLLAAVIGAASGDPAAALNAIKDCGIDSAFLLQELLYLGTQAYGTHITDHPVRTMILALNPAAAPLADILDDFYTQNGPRVLQILADGGDQALHLIADQLAKLGKPLSAVWSGVTGKVDDIRSWLFGP